MAYVPFKSIGKIFFGKFSLKDFAIAVPETLLVAALSGIGSALVSNKCLENKYIPIEPPEQSVPKNPKPDKKRLSFEEYGAVVYQKNPDFQNQLYIISQIHRNSLTGNYKDETGPRVQAEIYRIAEKLIKQNVIELLIDEGIDAQNSDSADLMGFIGKHIKSLMGSELSEKVSKSDSELERIMKGYIPCEEDPDFTIHIDAGYLLSAMYPIAHQGADSSLHHKATDKTVENFLTRGGNPKDFESIMDYLCKARSALILQNSPFVIEREIRAKRIKSRNAIIIIGDLHIDEMQEFIENDRIKISAVKNYGLPAVDEELCLAKRDYGAAIIKPLSIK